MKKKTLKQWLVYIENMHPQNIELGLERVSRVFRKLTDAHYASTQVITVAGTNGKGTTVHCITQCLLAKGLTVGTYTSPHLVRFNERVAINGKMLNDDSLIKAFEAVEVARVGGADENETSLTFFEFTTLAALWVFCQSDLDFWVLEVGMGGRLDAVNIVDADVAVVTSIGLDHMDWLGDTREAIATEKCGIMRPSRLAVCSDHAPPSSVAAHARAIGCTLYQLGEQFSLKSELEAGSSDTKSTVQYEGVKRQRTGLVVPAHVVMDNLAGALCALDVLDVLPSQEQINEVFYHWQLRGRQQIVNGPVRWWMDVAHNVDSVNALVLALERSPCAGKTIVIVGMLSDKAVSEVLGILSKYADQFIFTDLDSSRAMPASKLATLDMSDEEVPSMSVGSVAAACALAHARSVPGDRVLVTGSFYCVGPALAWHGL